VIEVSNADRIVFPAVGHTKGDVVAYYDRIAPRALFHLEGRLLSLRRFPKGLAGAGFFQKNVPAHYPASIERVAVPRHGGPSKKRGTDAPDVTIYPVLREPEHLAYLANQGAIELHAPSSRVAAPAFPDRFVLDLDPPPESHALVRRAALAAREMLGRFGLETVPIATGSKGYHVVGAIHPTVPAEALALAAQRLAALLAAEHADELTQAFRVALRKGRVFVDWLRNNPSATVVAPYSLRATPRATVATPLAWSEIERAAPDAYTIDDIDRLLDRPDTLADLSKAPGDAERLVGEVQSAFERSGLVLETFNRFRS
jgi:bifunctional non-homologous end joining protein LigD